MECLRKSRQGLGCGQEVVCRGAEEEGASGVKAADVWAESRGLTPEDSLESKAHGRPLHSKIYSEEQLLLFPPPLQALLGPKPELWGFYIILPKKA